MRKVFVLLLAILSLSVYAQEETSKERFSTEFKEADNEFAKIEAIKFANRIDSISNTKERPFFYDCIWECNYRNYKNITVSEKELLGLFMDGYMAGQQSFYYNKDFDYEYLYHKLKKIRRSSRRN